MRCNMQNLLRAYFCRSFVSLLFFSAFTLAFVTPAPAQTTSAPSQSDSDRARRAADADLSTREWQLRNIGRIKRVDVEVAPTTVTLGKIKEDYEGLQKANNNILTMLSTGRELDYRTIADASSEIRKRASRLKSYLLTLEMVKENEKRRKGSDEITAAQMKASLLSMDASIVRFIANPIFRDFGKVVDVDNSIKARDDLDSIVELSEKIKKSAERTMKETRGSR
jgi:hypothetical protein